MTNGHLEITIKTDNSKVKYVFKNAELKQYFENIIYAEMINLEGSKKLRLKDIAKIKG